MRRPGASATPGTHDFFRGLGTLVVVTTILRLGVLRLVLLVRHRVRTVSARHAREDAARRPRAGARVRAVSQRHNRRRFRIGRVRLVRVGDDERRVEHAMRRGPRPDRGVFLSRRVFRERHGRVQRPTRVVRRRGQGRRADPGHRGGLFRPARRRRRLLRLLHRVVPPATGEAAAAGARARVTRRGGGVRHGARKAAEEGDHLRARGGRRRGGGARRRRSRRRRSADAPNADPVPSLPSRRRKPRTPTRRSTRRSTRLEKAVGTGRSSSALYKAARRASGPLQAPRPRSPRRRGGYDRVGGDFTDDDGFTDDGDGFEDDLEDPDEEFEFDESDEDGEKGRRPRLTRRSPRRPGGRRSPTLDRRETRG